jgi:DNA-binding Lrp family transcriptional regulator
MKNTVNLLDNWRLSLYGNNDTFEVLSYIYRNLSTDQQEIADALGTPKARIANAIRELYSAGLIYTKSGQLLFASDKAAAVMESEDILDLSISSLSRELFQDWSTKTSAQHWHHLPTNEGHAAKQDHLYRMQVARCMNLTLGAPRQSVWEQVFTLLFSRKSKNDIVTTNHDRLLEVSFFHEATNVEDLESLLKASDARHDKKALEILDRSVMFLLVYWISNPRSDHSAKFQVNSKKYSDIFTSWRSQRGHYDASLLASALNRCQFERTFSAADMTDDRLLDEIKRIRQRTDESQKTRLSTSERILKFLLREHSDEAASTSE